MLNEKSQIGSILKSTSLIGILMVSFKILGFVKQAIVAKYFGVTVAMDLYSIANTFVTGFAAIFSEALFVSIVGKYTYFLVKKGRKKANEYLTGLFISIIPFFTLIALIMIIFASSFARLIGKNYLPNELELLEHNIRMITPVVILSSIVIICTAILDAEKKFFISRLESLINSIVIIIFTIFTASFLKTDALIYAEITSILLFCILMWRVVRKNYYPSFTHSLKSSGLLDTLYTAIPLLAGNATYRLNTMIDSFLSSRITGGPAALGYSHVLEQLVTIVFSTSIGNILFSYIANNVAEGKGDLSSKIIVKILRITLIIIVPITFITIIDVNNIVNIVYLRGHFDQQASLLTAAALKGYAIGFPFSILKNLITKSVYAYGNTKIPTIVGTISMLGNIILSIILSQYLGLLGISLATSVMSTFGFIILLLYVDRKYAKCLNKDLLKLVIKIIIVSTFTICILLFANLDRNFGIMGFFSISVIGGIVYFILLYFWNVPELIFVKNVLKDKLWKLY